MTKLEPFLAYCREVRGLAPSTIASYASALPRFEAAVGRSLLNWRPLDVERYLERAAKDGCQPRTLGAQLAMLRAFYRWAVTTGRLDKDPTYAVETPQAAKDGPSPPLLARKDVERLAVAAGRRAPLIRSLYLSGAHVSELIALRWGDLEKQDDGWFAMIGKGRKARRAPLKPSKRPRRAKDEDLVWPLSRVSVWRILQGAAERAKLKSPVSLRVLRQSRATHLLEAGASLVSVAGHLGRVSLDSTRAYTASAQPPRRIRTKG